MRACTADRVQVKCIETKTASSSSLVVVVVVAVVAFVILVVIQGVSQQLIYKKTTLFRDRAILVI